MKSGAGPIDFAWTCIFAGVTLFGCLVTERDRRKVLFWLDPSTVSFDRQDLFNG
jgi:hypothetical protein